MVVPPVHSVNLFGPLFPWYWARLRIKNKTGPATKYFIVWGVREIPLIADFPILTPFFKQMLYFLFHGENVRMNFFKLPSPLLTNSHILTDTSVALYLCLGKFAFARPALPPVLLTSFILFWWWFPPFIFSFSWVPFCHPISMLKISFPIPLLPLQASDLVLFISKVGKVVYT